MRPAAARVVPDVALAAQLVRAGFEVTYTYRDALVDTAPETGALASDALLTRGADGGDNVRARARRRDRQQDVVGPQPFERPYQRVRDTVRFMRKALTGEKVVEDYETFSINGFRLSFVPREPVPIMVAALRPGMLRLAGREGDGAIINWLSP